MISRYINSSGFAIILLSFLLPFVSIKCQNSNYSIYTFYGYNFLLGKEYKVDKNMFDDPFNFDKKGGEKTQYYDEPNEEQQDDDDDEHKSQRKKRQDKAWNRMSKGNIKPNIYIICVFILALGGFVISLVTARSQGVTVIIIAAGILMCLIVFSVTLKYILDFKSASEYETLKFMFRFAYEIGFWLMAVLALGLIIYNTALAVKQRNMKLELFPVQTANGQQTQQRVQQMPPAVENKDENTPPHTPDMG